MNDIIIAIGCGLIVAIFFCWLLYEIKKESELIATKKK